MTTIPAAVDALVNVCRTALPDARVDDGPSPDDFERATDGTDVGVVVGWSEDGRAIDTEISREGAAGDDRELYRINCEMFVARGDVDTKPLRDSVFDMYEAIKAQLRIEHPLVKGVLSARVEFVDYDAGPIENGWEAVLRFGVLVDAFDR